MEQHEAKLAALTERMLALAAADGRRCVPGEGPSLSPALLLIGEAPGGQEEAQGRPFVGKAGQNLNEFLQAVGLQREDIRITNTVKVRPTRTSPRGTVSNRPPNRQELDMWIPLLLEEIALTGPGIIVTLGNTPLQALLGKDAVIGACHGRVLSCMVQGREIPLFPLYHPAAVIYNRSLGEIYRQDLQQLRRYLDGDLSFEAQK